MKLSGEVLGNKETGECIDPKKPIDSFTLSNASGLGIFAVTIEE